MLTPRFDLSQTDNEISVNVYAPYANIKDTEVFVEGTDFRFFASPYYLRLKLPGEIIENDDSSGSYDCDKGLFVLKFSKVNKGEHFENLDMITTLLEPPKEKKNIVPSIEVIGNPSAELNDGTDPILNIENDETTNGDEWYMHQAAPPSVINMLSSAPKYGFGNKISGALSSFDSGWLKDVIDLPSPDITPMEERKKLRDADELQHFNEDHYMADLVEDENKIGSIVESEQSWYNLKSEDIQLTDKEKDILKELSNKEFLLDDKELQTVIFGLVDILFGSCYNNLVTYGENDSESSWNINKISATLSWFQNFSSMRDVVNTCVRRSLCFPLFRHWNLAMKVLQDVIRTIELGKKFILKKFCEIYDLFNHSFEPRYLLNQLYIRDYIIWIQKAPDTLIEATAKSLKNIVPKKEDMGFDLVELETAAWSVFYEEQNEIQQNMVIENTLHDVEDQLSKMDLKNNGKESSRTSDSSSEDSESDSDTDSDTSSSSSCSSCSSSSSSSTCPSSSSSSSIGPPNTSSDSDEGEEKPIIIKITEKNNGLDSDDFSASDEEK